MSETKHENVIVIGSGPAGHTAAMYLARAGYSPLVIAGALTPGGQLMNTTEVENYPGFPEGILGPDLMDRMKQQAERFGARYLNDDVASLQHLASSDDADNEAVTNTNAATADDDSSHYRCAVTCAGGDRFAARAAIITVGSEVRKLGVPGEKEFSGNGVSYCATCDGFFFKDKPIIVVGGGDSAMEEALFLTRYGSSVTLIHRRDSFRASQIMVDRVMADPKITVMTNTVVTEILGDSDAKQTATFNIPGLSGAGTTLGSFAPKLSLGDGNQLQVAGSQGSGSHTDARQAAAPQHVESIKVRNTLTGAESTIPARGVFIAIGHTPATECIDPAVERDADGYLLTQGASTRTNVPGIFAAGDCVDRVYRQAISAAGMGCRAALDAQAFLTDQDTGSSSNC